MIIYKIILDETQGDQVFYLPDDTEFLTAREQHEAVAVWFRCDEARLKVPFTLRVHGTGVDEAPDPDYWRYLGTAQVLRFVWHVFVKTEEKVMRT